MRRLTRPTRLADLDAHLAAAPPAAPVLPTRLHSSPASGLRGWRRRATAGLVAAAVGLPTALSLTACLEPPGVGTAADPTRAHGPAPWGSATSNAELEKKRKLLEDVLDGKLTAATLGARLQKDFPELNEEQRKRSLVAITTIVEDLNKSGRLGQAVPAGPERDMSMAQLFFAERRFIEAATLLSKVLDDNPTIPGARNLLARCFFFLGNRDRTVEELEFVLQSPVHQQDKDEILDALFLLGAAVAETPGMSRANLEKAKGAWETYLKIAPAGSPMIEHVQRGLPDLEAGLRGEGPLAQPLVPMRGGQDDTGSDSRGVLGGGGGAPPAAASTGPAPSAPQARARRAEQLPADAPPVQVAVARGEDALDVKDLATAEARFNEALGLEAGNPAALVGLGRVYVQLGRVPDALRVFGEAIKRHPDFVPAWHYNGMAQIMAGSPKEAVASWEKVQEKDPAYFARFNLDKRIDAARRMN